MPPASFEKGGRYSSTSLALSVRQRPLHLDPSVPAGTGVSLAGLECGVGAAAAIAETAVRAVILRSFTRL